MAGLKISVSEARTLLDCARRHNYQYRRGLVPLAPPAPFLTKGSWVHKILELHYKNDQDQDIHKLDRMALELSAQDEDLIAPDYTVRADAISMVSELLSSPTYRPPVKVVAVEEEIMEDIGLLDPQTNEPVMFHGFIDLIGEWGNGDLFIADHKTAARNWDAEKWDFDMQGPLYQLAVMKKWYREHGKLVQPDVVFNFMTPKASFQRTMYVPPSRSNAVGDDLQHILFMRAANVAHRNPTYSCRWCDFKEPCVAALHGYDEEQYLEDNYVVDEDRLAALPTE